MTQEGIGSGRAGVRQDDKDAHRCVAGRGAPGRLCRSLYNLSKHLRRHARKLHIWPLQATFQAGTFRNATFQPTGKAYSVDILRIIW